MLNNLLLSAEPYCKDGKLYKQVKQKWGHQLLLWKSALSLLTKTVYSCASVFKASAGENVQGNLHVMLWSLFEAGLYMAL